MEMLLGNDLVEATFIERPNRFLSRVEIEGKEYLSHVPDPGRLKELLFPGAKVLVQPKAGAERKTKFATVMVYSGEELISINSQLPNRFVRFCLDHQGIPELADWSVKKQEFTLGRSRIDFLLEKNGKEKLLEVKSVTLVEEGVARFPDAVTERGRRHVLHLIDSITPERSAGVLFVIQRSDAISFQPHWQRDPKFAQALAASVEKGLELYIYTSQIEPHRMTLGQSIPYDLAKYE